MSQGTIAYVVAWTALITGTVAGFWIQITAMSLLKNGEWPNVPAWKRRSIGMSGSIAAFVAGAWVLSNAPSFSGHQLILRMLVWQTAAAWLGAAFMDVVGEAIKKRRGGS